MKPSKRIILGEGYPVLIYMGAHVGVGLFSNKSSRGLSYDLKLPVKYGVKGRLVFEVMEEKKK